jgi:hypothetical protein
MVQHVVYLVKCYDISSKLVVNTDQTGTHLMPTWGIRTWEEKGTKSVAVVEQEDKRHVIAAVSSSATRDMLPFQVIFIGIIRKSLLPMNNNRKLCGNIG